MIERKWEIATASLGSQRQAELLEGGWEPFGVYRDTAVGAYIVLRRSVPPDPNACPDCGVDIGVLHRAGCPQLGGMSTEIRGAV